MTAAPTRLQNDLLPVQDTPGYYEGMRLADHIERAAEKRVGIASLDRISLEKIT